MSDRAAAANAVVSFQGYAEAMMAGEMPAIVLDTDTEHFKYVNNISGLWDDSDVPPLDFVDTLDEESLQQLIDSFIKIADEIVSLDALPVGGGADAIQKIWEQMRVKALN